MGTVGVVGRSSAPDNVGDGGPLSALSSCTERSSCVSLTVLPILGLYLTISFQVTRAIISLTVSLSLSHKLTDDAHNDLGIGQLTVEQQGQHIVADLLDSGRGACVASVYRIE